MGTKRWVWVVIAMIQAVALGINGGMTVYGYWVERIQSDWMINTSQEVTVKVTGLALGISAPEVEELPDGEVPVPEWQGDRGGNAWVSGDPKPETVPPLGHSGERDTADTADTHESPQPARGWGERDQDILREPQTPARPDVDIADDKAKAGDD